MGSPSPILPGEPPFAPHSVPFWLKVVYSLPFLWMLGQGTIRKLRGRRPTWKQGELVDVFIFGALQLVGLLAAFYQARIPGIWRYFVTIFGLHLTQVFAMALVVGLGWCAHRFKRRNKLFYGYLEVSFGALLAITVVSRVNFAAIDFSDLGLAKGVALVGAAYVVARGLNNCYDAKHPTTPIG